jgi:hypothetical protein
VELRKEGDESCVWARADDRPKTVMEREMMIPNFAAAYFVFKVLSSCLGPETVYAARVFTVFMSYFGQMP